MRAGEDGFRGVVGGPQREEEADDGPDAEGLAAGAGKSLELVAEDGHGAVGKDGAELVDLVGDDVGVGEEAEEGDEGGECGEDGEQAVEGDGGGLGLQAVGGDVVEDALEGGPPAVVGGSVGEGGGGGHGGFPSSVRGENGGEGWGFW